MWPVETRSGVLLVVQCLRLLVLEVCVGHGARSKCIVTATEHPSREITIQWLGLDVEVF